MNRLLSASAFLCSTLGLVLMILACFLVPHHVVLGDDPGGTGSGASVNCTGCNGCAGTSTPCASTPPTCVSGSPCEANCGCTEHPNGGGKCWCRE
jgi:hypothetical protein